MWVGSKTSGFYIALDVSALETVWTCLRIFKSCYAVSILSCQTHCIKQLYALFVLMSEITTFSTEPFCLAHYPSAFHSVMFNPVEPRLLATANSKEGVGLWDIRKPQR